MELVAYSEAAKATIGVLRLAAYIVTFVNGDPVCFTRLDVFFCDITKLRRPSKGWGVYLGDTQVFEYATEEFEYVLRTRLLREVEKFY